MRYGTVLSLILGTLLALVWSSSNILLAQNQEQLQYSVVFSDSKDVTHFRYEVLPWQPTEGTAGPLLATAFLDAEKIGFLRIPRAYRADWHPAPSRRFVMVLSGSAEIEVGDGERRTFGPGSVVLVTDTKGRGHRTNAVGNQNVFLVWVPVPER
jgi:mannose-6-phosphate isomerase-like protein (cupin superfamily)